MPNFSKSRMMNHQTMYNISFKKVFLDYAIKETSKYGGGPE